MSFNPVFQSLNSDYAFLYLPTIVYAYLLTETNLQTVNLYFTTVSADSFFQIAAIICLIGALLYHQVMRLIFGDGGPSENPKKTTVALRHSIMIVLNCDLRDVENDIVEIFKKCSNRIGVKHIIRLIAFGVPIVGMYLLTYFSLLPLYRSIISEGTLVGGLLFIALLVPLLQSRLWSFFPNYAPPETAENIWVPEYVRGAEAARKSTEQRKLSEWE